MSTTKIARQDITGNVFLSRGRWYARLPLGGGKRHCSPMPWAEHEEQARARVGIMAELAVKVRSTGDAATIETLPGILDRASKSTDPAELDRLRELVSRIAGGKVVSSKASAAPIGETFGDVAKAWTSGELAKKYPDHVKAKKDDATDGYRLDKHVLPVVGSVPLRSFTLAHAERVLERLPPTLSPASRRHVAQLVQRVLGLAVYPLKLRDASPIPRGWLPKKGTEKAKAALYPADEARLVSSPDVLLCERVLFGFLAREGMRDVGGRRAHVGQPGPRRRARAPRREQDGRPTRVGDLPRRGPRPSLVARPAGGREPRLRRAGRPCLRPGERRQGERGSPRRTPPPRPRRRWGEAPRALRGDQRAPPPSGTRPARHLRDRLPGDRPQ
jgi:hypothetical protein